MFKAQAEMATSFWVVGGKMWTRLATKNPSLFDFHLLPHTLILILLIYMNFPSLHLLVKAMNSENDREIQNKKVYISPLGNVLRQTGFSE